MAYKLTIEIKDDSSLQVSSEGQIDPTILIGTLEIVKNDAINTLNRMMKEKE